MSRIPLQEGCDTEGDTLPRTNGHGLTEVPELTGVQGLTEVEGLTAVRRMPKPIANATAYLEKLEADRRAAMALSEQKAEEARLITARKEGFQAAMDILAGAISVDGCELQPVKAGRRKPRRDIPELILRELSFAGQAMTTTQIAKAIDYLPERTETVLKRLELGGKLMRNESGRWIVAITAIGEPNGHAAGAHRKSLSDFPEC
jgi:hypothetical protein